LQGGASRITDVDARPPTPFFLFWENSCTGISQKKIKFPVQGFSCTGIPVQGSRKSENSLFGEHKNNICAEFPTPKNADFSERDFRRGNIKIPVQEFSIIFQKK